MRYKFARGVVLIPTRRALHVPHGGPGWERLSRVPSRVHLSGWHKPDGPCVVRVQEYPPAGCINSFEAAALSVMSMLSFISTERPYLVVEFRWLVVGLVVVGGGGSGWCWFTFIYLLHLHFSYLHLLSYISVGLQVAGYMLVMLVALTYV